MQDIKNNGNTTTENHLKNNTYCETLQLKISHVDTHREREREKDRIVSTIITNMISYNAKDAATDK